MTYSACQPRRLMALVLTLALLLTGWTVPAYAQEDWELLNIRLTWQDASGNTYETYASPVSWSEDHAYWAQVSADAPGWHATSRRACSPLGSATCQCSRRMIFPGKTTCLLSSFSVS